ncbi:MAG: YdeI family protein [Flavobacteriaceae bacterium]
MEKAEKLEAYFAKDRPFKEGIDKLRELAGKTLAEETYKWSAPVYTLSNKNVFWIAAFKNHFSLGFFNGALLRDEKKLLVNAQEGKTQAMRHLKFTDENQIDDTVVLAYINEALENEKKGLKVMPAKKKKAPMAIPDLLQAALDKNPSLSANFKALTPYKQREYADYITDAKQERTKHTRLDKILPIIGEGKGLNDKYRNC